MDSIIAILTMLTAQVCLEHVRDIQSRRISCVLGAPRYFAMLSWLITLRFATFASVAETRRKRRQLKTRFLFLDLDFRKVAPQ